MNKSKITYDDRALGKRIKKLRKRADISQEQLAERTHLTQTHVSLIETAKRKASMITLKKFASALKVKVRDLIPF